MSDASSKFTITYSQNGDGGKQEYNTALEALRRVFPDASVVENRVNVYPIRVVITSGESAGSEIWSGRQQDLFSKYYDRRVEAMSEIEGNLLNFKSKL